MINLPRKPEPVSESEDKSGSEKQKRNGKRTQKKKKKDRRLVLKDCSKRQGNMFFSSSLTHASRLLAIVQVLVIVIAIVFPGYH